MYESLIVSGKDVSQRLLGKADFYPTKDSSIKKMQPSSTSRNSKEKSEVVKTG